MESNEKNGNVGIERNNQKVNKPLTREDIKAILETMPEGLDADEFIIRLCNEAIHYSFRLKKEQALQAMHDANKKLGLYDDY